ncbi:AAEL002213-PA [Aedes aegypti]|uniref:AAEL002213-PA n=1 Tax=Aedes aegypti TaxID=7159 RepID=Q17IZ5_AEDAE|nr:AAEL002213-PA [Aedes aegypti]
MRIIASILAIVATVASQNVVPVPPPGPILPPVEQQEYAPVQPLTPPFNVAPDGFYGYQPYANAVPQQTPFNNFSPVPYQYPIAAYPHPVYPNPAYPQFPGFPQFPQFFPQFPSPFQPSVHPVLQPQAASQAAPQPNPAPVPFVNFQIPQATSPQQLLRPASIPPQGVNGLTKPVNTPYVNSNANQAYGSAYGMYVAAPVATSPNTGARYEAVSGDTVHTASLPGHGKDYKVVSGQAAPVRAPVTGKQ